jgi:hypothetical protein
VVDSKDDKAESSSIVSPPLLPPPKTTTLLLIKPSPGLRCKKKNIRSLDNVRYLPAVVWVAAGLGACLCFIACSYFFILEAGTIKTIDNAQKNSREAAQLLDVLANNVNNVTLADVSSTLEETSLLLDQYATLLSNTGQTDQAAEVAQLSALASNTYVAVNVLTDAVNGTNVLEIAEEGGAILTSIADLLEDTRRRYRTINSISALAALFAAGIATYRSVRSFRRVRIAVRKGGNSSGNIKDLHDDKAWTASKANKFIGIQVGSVVSGVLLVYVVVFSFLFLISWSQTWKLVVENGSVIFTVFNRVVTAVNVLFFDRVVCNHWLSDGYWIHWPILWSWFNSFITFQRAPSLVFCTAYSGLFSWYLSHCVRHSCLTRLCSQISYRNMTVATARSWL